MDVNGISVLVCCYNSESRIGDTLKALSKQKYAKGCKLELLVLDNGSTDNTYNKAIEVCEFLNFPWSWEVLKEPKSGKSNAIALGFQRAAYKYVAIVDDDNWLMPDYLATAWQLLEDNSAIGVLGGQGVPEWEIIPPAWFSTYALDYATGPQGIESGDITDTKGYLYGAGQVIRKSAWQRVLAAGFQSILTGRKGAKLSSGEDNEMCYAIVLAGYRIWYDERLKFKHFIPAKRLQWQHVLNLYAGNAVSEAALSPYLYFMRDSHAVYEPLRKLVSLRHSVSMAQYCIRYGWQGLRDRNLLAEASISRVRLRYYWQSIWKHLAKEMKQNKGYEEVRRFIKRLAALETI